VGWGDSLIASLQLEVPARAGTVMRLPTSLLGGHAPLPTVLGRPPNPALEAAPLTAAPRNPCRPLRGMPVPVMSETAFSACKKHVVGATTSL